MDRTETYQNIQSHLATGGRVMVATYTRATVYQAKHREMFLLGKSGSIYVKRGKRQECIDFCAIKFI